MDMKNYHLEECFFVGIVVFIVGVVMIGINVKFSVDKFQGKYKRVPAVITGYERQEYEDGVDYTIIYQYKEDGNIASFKGHEVSVLNIFRNMNIGKKVFLYRNTKTNQLRESPRILGFFGVVCICIGICLIYYNHRMNRKRMEYQNRY